MKSEVAFDRARICEEHRWIARTARCFFRRNRVTRDASAGVKHFAHRVTAASPDVPREELSRPKLSSAKRPERQKMRFDQILDVYVVAHTRSVGRRPIGPEEGDMRALSECDLERDRNKVRLRSVIFAESPLGIAAHDVEVAQCDRRERRGVGRTARGAEESFEAEFRFAVWIDGSLRS